MDTEEIQENWRDKSKVFYLPMSWIIPKLEEQRTVTKSELGAHIRLWDDYHFIDQKSWILIENNLEDGK